MNLISGTRNNIVIYFVICIMGTDLVNNSNEYLNTEIFVQVKDIPETAALFHRTPVLHCYKFIDTAYSEADL